MIASILWGGWLELLPIILIGVALFCWSALKFLDERDDL